MDGVVSPAAQQSLISSFLEIAVGQTADTARQFLQATNWKLEEAIQLFYVRSEEGGSTASSSFQPPPQTPIASQTNNSDPSRDFIRDSSFQGDGSDVRAPLPVIREALYGDAPLYRASRIGNPSGPSHGPSSMVAFRNFQEEMAYPRVWESEKVGPCKEDSRDNLAALYRPPFALLHHGPFEKAKLDAATEDKWLLLNLQSNREFSSHMLNRDTWANEAVAQTIRSNFIFWQVYNDTSEGSKICTYYKVDSLPVVLLIDPITGRKMRSWNGMVHPDQLLEDLLPFMDGGPNNHVTLPLKRSRENFQMPSKEVQDEEDEELKKALAASLESIGDCDEFASEGKDVGTSVSTGDVNFERKPLYPPLPDEPKGERSLLCRVGFRLPDSRRVQRNFLRNDPIQLLWSFCASQLGEDEAKPFRLMHAIPGAPQLLEYDSTLTFEESKLANSMISVTWE